MAAKIPTTRKGAKPKTVAPVEKLCFSHERRLLAGGCRFVAGVDEAGRGPLAGPVVAAAVVLDPERIPAGLDDSKVLKADQRECLYEAIMATAFVAVASAGAQRIDAINIRQATLWAMCAAVGALPLVPDRVLVDGREFPDGLPCPAEPIVGGDGLVLSIAAASIIAKVTRDRMMKRAATLFQGYGFERHMGYATPEHRVALERLGPCPMHRRSFAPVRESQRTLPVLSTAAE